MANCPSDPYPLQSALGTERLKRVPSAGSEGTASSVQTAVKITRTEPALGGTHCQGSGEDHWALTAMLLRTRRCHTSPSGTSPSAGFS